MGANRKFIITFILMVCCACPIQLRAALAEQASTASSSTKASSDEVRMIEPADLFPDFPEFAWGMSFQAARKAIEKSGAHPGGFRKAETELAWDGKFSGMDGRATVLFKEGVGLYEVAVLVYASDKRQEVFDHLMRKISDRHGAAKEAEENSVAISKVWRLKNGFAIELRLIKDDDSPVVDVHWVKE